MEAPPPGEWGSDRSELHADRDGRIGPHHRDDDPTSSRKGDAIGACAASHRTGAIGSVPQTQHGAGNACVGGLCGTKNMPQSMGGGGTEMVIEGAVHTQFFIAWHQSLSSSSPPACDRPIRLLKAWKEIVVRYDAHDSIDRKQHTHGPHIFPTTTRARDTR